MSSNNNLKPISITEIDDLVRDNTNKNSFVPNDDRWRNLNLVDNPMEISGVTQFDEEDNNKLTKFAVGK